MDMSHDMYSGINSTTTNSSCLPLEGKKRSLFIMLFNKIAIPNSKFQMASGQGSHWLIESPKKISSMCSLPS